MSANAGLIILETYVQQGKTIENLFFIYAKGGKMWKKCLFFLVIWGALGAFNDQTGPILLSSYPSTHINVYVK